MSNSATISLGAFEVVTSENKGHDVEFWATTATNRIVNVGAKSHPIIAQQAEAFKQAVHQTVLYYMKEALNSDRTTLASELEQQGHKDMADIIRRL